MLPSRLRGWILCKRTLCQVCPSRGMPVLLTSCDRLSSSCSSWSNGAFGFGLGSSVDAPSDGQALPPPALQVVGLPTSTTAMSTRLLRCCNQDPIWLSAPNSRVSFSFCDSQSTLTMSKCRAACPNAHGQLLEPSNAMSATTFGTRCSQPDAAVRVVHAFLHSAASFCVSSVWWFQVRLAQSVSAQECSFCLEYHVLSSSP